MSSTEQTFYGVLLGVLGFAFLFGRKRNGLNSIEEARLRKLARRLQEQGIAP